MPYNELNMQTGYGRVILQGVFSPFFPSLSFFISSFFLFCSFLLIRNRLSCLLFHLIFVLFFLFLCHSLSRHLSLASLYVYLFFSLSLSFVSILLFITLHSLCVDQSPYPRLPPPLSLFHTLFPYSFTES